MANRHDAPMTNTNNFGPRIIGKEAFAAKQKATVGRAHFGPRVGGPSPASATTAPGAASTAGAAPESGVSIEQFIATLTENPAFFETLYLAELQRAEGPRRECLVEARKHTTDDATLAEIDELLAEMDGAAPRDAEKLAAEVARIEAIGKLTDLQAEADKLELGLSFRSKKEAREAIIAKLSEHAPAQ